MSSRQAPRTGVLATLVVVLVALWAPVHRATHHASEHANDGTHAGCRHAQDQDAQDRDAHEHDEHDDDCALCELVPLPPATAAEAPLPAHGLVGNALLATRSALHARRVEKRPARGPPVNAESPQV